MKNQNSHPQPPHHQHPPYLIKPKYIFKHPFLKFDLQNPTNRQAQNQQLTEYFNYGFNQDTMNVYAKLVNRMIKVLDHKKNLQYFDEPSQLMRLNDEIPMDFGGFCKFYDPSLIQSTAIPSQDKLFQNFVWHCVESTIKRVQYPMIEFVKSMYKKENEEENEDNVANNLSQFVDEIGNNLQKKYGETMQKLIEEKNKPKESIYPKFKKPFKKNPYNPNHPKNGAPESQTQKSIKQESFVKIQAKTEDFGKKYQKKQDKKQDKKNEKRSKTSEKDKKKQKKLKNRQRSSSSSSSSSSGSSSSSSSDSSSSSSEDSSQRRRRKSKNDRKSRQKRNSSTDKRRQKGRSDHGKSLKQKKQSKKQKSRSQKQRRSVHNKKDKNRQRSRDNKRKHK